MVSDDFKGRIFYLLRSRGAMVEVHDIFVVLEGTLDDLVSKDFGSSKDPGIR
jgi:hypothetical protein